MIQTVVQVSKQSDWLVWCCPIVVVSLFIYDYSFIIVGLFFTKMKPKKFKEFYSLSLCVLVWKCVCVCVNPDTLTYQTILFCTHTRDRIFCFWTESFLFVPKRNGCNGNSWNQILVVWLYNRTIRFVITALNTENQFSTEPTKKTGLNSNQKNHWPCK